MKDAEWVAENIAKQVMNRIRGVPEFEIAWHILKRVRPAGLQDLRAGITSILKGYIKAAKTGPTPAMLDEEKRGEVAAKLLTTMWLHPAYRLDYRSNWGALLSALDYLSPEAARRLREGETAQEVGEALYPDSRKDLPNDKG